MKATLLLFSGRFDPVWFLSPEECDKFHEQLRILDGTMMKQDYPGLGYHGIQIADSEDMILIYNSIVEVISGLEVRRFFDYNRELEKWVFKTAVGKVSDEILTKVQELQDA